MTWTEETMLTINKLTQDIQGKAFDPDWFLLRQRFEQFEDQLPTLTQEVERLKGENAALASNVLQSKIELGKILSVSIHKDDVAKLRTTLAQCVEALAVAQHAIIEIKICCLCSLDQCQCHALATEASDKTTLALTSARQHIQKK